MLPIRSAARQTCVCLPFPLAACAASPVDRELAALASLAGLFLVCGFVGVWSLVAGATVGSSPRHARDIDLLAAVALLAGVLLVLFLAAGGGAP